MNDIEKAIEKLEAEIKVNEKRIERRKRSLLL